jgi:hypothetical protein
MENDWAQISLALRGRAIGGDTNFPNDFDNPGEVKHGAVGWQRSHHLRVLHLD